MLNPIKIVETNTIQEISIPIGVLYKQFFPKETSVSHHRHTDPYISFVASGNYLEKGPRTEFLCDKNTAIIHPANDEHSNHFNRDSKVLSLFFGNTWLDKQGDFPNDFKSCTFKSAKMKILFDKISEEMKTNDPFGCMIMEGLALEVFGEILRHISGKNVSSGEEIAQKAMEYLHDNIEGTVYLRDLSDALNVQKIYIARSFKKATGFSIGEYMRKIKVQKACELLQHTSLPICEIALDAGFCDQSHLNNVFKREIRTTPLVYRKNCLAG